LSQPVNARRFGIWLIVAAGFVVFYALVHGLASDPTSGGIDWQRLWRNGALGDMSQLTTPRWSLFLSYLPARFADPIGYLIWIGVGAVLVLLVANHFGSPLPLVLISYQLNWVFYYGQIEPYVVAGIGLGSLALRRSNPWLLGIALALATMKPQVGGLVALYLLLRSPNHLKTVLTYIGIIALSLIAWPGWPLVYLTEQILPFYDRYEDAIWYFNASLGLPVLLGLPLSALALWLPLDPKQKMQALVATNLLVSPYSPIYSQLSLFCLGLPIPFYLFGLIPWIIAIAFGPFGHWQWTFVFPLGVLVSCYAAALQRPGGWRMLRKITGKDRDETVKTL
jgi:hypothetical protein